MRVIVTDQSIGRLEESLLFYITELEIPLEKVVEIKNKLLKRTESLSENPYKGQYEPYLKKFGKGHRRIIEGNFKIIYRIEGNTVYVTDFFDSRKNSKEMR